MKDVLAGVWMRSLNDFSTFASINTLELYIMLHSVSKVTSYGASISSSKKNKMTQLSSNGSESDSCFLLNENPDKNGKFLVISQHMGILQGLYLCNEGL